MTYDPKEYWERRGDDYRVSVDTSEELENLAGLIGKHCHPRPIVLEVGPGYGRIYKFLVNERVLVEAKRYFMADIVQSMALGCQRETGRIPTLWDGIELPWNSGTFDLVISFSVLLHVPPTDIEQHFSECVRVSRDLIFVATYAGGHNGALAAHCFEHDYHSLFESHGLKVVDRRFFMGRKRANWLLGVPGE